MNDERERFFNEVMGRATRDDLMNACAGPSSRGTGRMGLDLKVPMTLANRLKETICVVFGHDWNAYGSIKDERGQILEEYRECDRCGLENHDRSGYLRR
jgi:hypothetical protein